MLTRIILIVLALTSLATAQRITLAPLTDPARSTPATPAQTEPAWFNVAATGRVVYMSSAGADTNAGTIDKPVKTIDAAKRLSPQRILLKCGDTFPAFASVQINGTPAAPTVIGSYGSGPRPRIIGTTDTALRFWFTSDMVISGLDLSNPAGYTCEVVGSKRILIEDCVIRDGQTNLLIEGRVDRSGILQRNQGVTVRGCIIVDAWSDKSRSQGIYTADTDGLVIEWTLLDRNGWKPGQQMPAPPEGNHNLYVHESCGPVVVRDSISAQACATGLMLRHGGSITDSLLWNNPIHIVIQGNDGRVERNAVYGTMRLAGDTKYNVQQYGERRDWGITVGMAGGAIARNHVEGMAQPIIVGTITRADPGASDQLGVIGNYGKGVIAVPLNRPGLTVQPFIARPMPAIDFPALLTGARLQRKGAWKAQYTSHVATASL